MTRLDSERKNSISLRKLGYRLPVSGSTVLCLVCPLRKFVAMEWVSPMRISVESTTHLSFSSPPSVSREYKIHINRETYTNAHARD